ncbi:hypothetical protein [Streptomyces caniscabiei]|uniref:hypothetical protein n=1 Tax=Streptomyces caniscabiei TaxID=2746961 RepID=UPI0029B7A46E|nr:hypothetical protein [Streptomyces caniscabiei]MDX3731459.1 hypothetical protein [Streptomyces caniscabiei]
MPEPLDAPPRLLRRMVGYGYGYGYGAVLHTAFTAITVVAGRAREGCADPGLGGG